MIWDPNWSVTNDEMVSGVSVYPNPLRPGATLYLLGDVKEANQVAIFDVSGRMVLQMELKDAKNPSLVLPNDLQKGFYLLQLRNGNSVVMNRKLLII
jgi:hypothetical protein